MIHLLVKTCKPFYMLLSKWDLNKGRERPHAPSDKCHPNLVLNDRIAGSVIKEKLEIFLNYRRSGIAHIEIFEIIYD
jgi:hypothetical protein